MPRSTECLRTPARQRSCDYCAGVVFDITGQRQDELQLRQAAAAEGFLAEAVQDYCADCADALLLRRLDPRESQSKGPERAQLDGVDTRAVEAERYDRSAVR